MPFDSTGNFTRIHNWENDRLNDVDIVSDRHDEEDDNFAQGISACLCKDGRSVMSGNLNVGGYRVINIGSAQASTDAVNKSQLDGAVSSVNSSVSALDSAVVKLTGDQIVSGIKKFVSTTTDHFVEIQSSSSPYLLLHQPNNSYIALAKVGNTTALSVLNGDLLSFVPVYCGNSDVSGSAVTTAAINKAENGFVKLGNGLIIQWGHSSVDGSTVTLPTPFTTTNYRVCATYMKSSGSIGDWAGHIVTYPTYTTAFYADTEAGEYQWIAIGY